MLLTEQCLQWRLHLSVRMIVPRIGSRLRKMIDRMPKWAKCKKEEIFRQTRLPSWRIFINYSIRMQRVSTRLSLTDNLAFRNTGTNYSENVPRGYFRHHRCPPYIPPKKQLSAIQWREKNFPSCTKDRKEPDVAGEPQKNAALSFPNNDGLV